MSYKVFVVVYRIRVIMYRRYYFSVFLVYGSQQFIVGFKLDEFGMKIVYFYYIDCVGS